MGGDAGSMLANVAGRALGVLSALPSRGGGFSNLANYMARRQQAMSDPNVRAALTPFGAGFYQIGGDVRPTAVAQPRDFLGPPAPGPSIWQPNLPPLAPEAALQEQAARETRAGLLSTDVVTRARAKQDAKIPLTAEETNALIAAGKELRRAAGEESSVSIGPGGTTVTIGSRYVLPPGVVQTPAQGEMPLDQLQPQLLPGQVPQATGRTNAQGQPLYQPVTPPKVDLRPETLPPLGGPPAAAPPAAAPPAPRPGNVNLNAPFFRQLEAERNLPTGVLSGLAEQESGGNPQAANPESTARGLYQITKGTAQAWGISADDRYDPVKSAIATADTLADRAKQVGIVRAVGMHYGGPAAPFTEQVGPSGLSPAQFAASVFGKAQKYATSVAAPFAGGTAYAVERPPEAAPPPAPAPVAVAPPPPPPPPPPPAAPPAAPAVVVAPAPAPAPAPVMVAAAAPPPENLIGYPSPAPSIPGVNVPATSIVLPPEAGTQLVPPTGPVPVLGPGGLPIESLSQTSQAGETRTFKAPEDLAAAQREAIMKQEVERLRGAGTVEDQKTLNQLYNYRTKLAELKAEFPTPAEREPWVGKPTRQFVAGMLERVQEPEKKRVAFQGAVAPFSLKAFETSGATMSENEERMILPNLPTGDEASATRFEDKLGRFEDGLEAAIAFRTTISRLPVEQRTPEVLNAVQNQVMEQQQARKRAREEAAGAPPAAAAPPAASPPPPPAPPGSATTITPTTPPPPTAAAAPSPTGPVTATAGAPTALPTVGTALHETFLPRRTLMSEAPSIGGSVLLGTAAGYTGPAAPYVAPVAAGIGGALGEAGQVGLEQVMGWPPAERGTLSQRMMRAGARGATGELATIPFRIGAKLVTRATGPTLRAAEELAPVLTGTVPAEATVTRMTGTSLADVAAEHVAVDTLLKKPAALAGVNLAPEAQQMLLTRWWQQNAEQGAGKLVKAWDALGDDAQRALAGEQRGAMTTLVDSLRVSGEPLSQMTLGQFATTTVPGGVLAAAGHPYLAVGAGLATEATRRAAPTLLVHPAGARVLASLPQVGRRVASPWVTAPGRMALQTGVAENWPMPERETAP